MKLATVEKNNVPVVCAVDTKRGLLLDIAQAALALGNANAPFATMLDLIDADTAGLDQARAAAEKWPDEASFALSGVKLLSPLPVPRQIRDCLVFEEHLTNSMAQWERMTGRPSLPIPQAWYTRPTYYKGNVYSVVGHEADITWPSYSEQMDYELELACITGRKGKDVPPERALAHVFGYTIFNDFSARDLQGVERPFGMGPMKSKDFDTGNVFGPWIVTPDEIGDPHKLDMEVRLNGKRVGGGNSSKMHHKFDFIVSFMTLAETVYPGTVIASGTVGTGSGFESNSFLKPDDVIELEIEKIGILRNKIVRKS